MMYLIPTAAILLAGFLLLPLRKKCTETGFVRRRMLTNAGIFGVTALLLVAMAAVGVFAEGVPAAAETAEAAAAAGNAAGMGYLAAALSTGLSCVGAGIAIASTAPAAIGAFSEDPKAFGKALIFVVLGEGVALYGLLISILIINAL